jgi:phage tail protein X
MTLRLRCVVLACACALAGCAGATRHASPGLAPETAALPGDARLSCGDLHAQMNRMTLIAQAAQTRMTRDNADEGELWPGTGTGDMATAMSLEADSAWQQQQVAQAQARYAHLQALSERARCA